MTIRRVSKHEQPAVASDGLARLERSHTSSPGRGRKIWSVLLRNRLAFVGAIFLIVITSAAVFAPLIASHSPSDQNLLFRLKAPSGEHWLGTDEVGRDVFSRLVHGARISLFIGVVGTIGGVILGTFIGMVSGFFGGWTDTLTMRVIDIMYAFPGVLLAILIIAVMGPSLTNLIIALTIWGTPTLSRIVRSSVLSLKSEEFIEAAHAIGATKTRIMLRHLLPNSSAPIIVYATLGVAGSLLTAAGLGFLGLGVQPPTAEWGAMLSAGRQYLRDAPHLVTFPGLLIFFTVVSLNLIGDALRDALDPHLQ